MNEQGALLIANFLTLYGLISCVSFFVLKLVVGRLQFFKSENVEKRFINIIESQGGSDRFYDIFRLLSTGVIPVLGGILSTREISFPDPQKGILTILLVSGFAVIGFLSTDSRLWKLEKFLGTGKSKTATFLRRMLAEVLLIVLVCSPLTLILLNPNARYIALVCLNIILVVFPLYWIIKRVGRLRFSLCILLGIMCFVCTNLIDIWSGPNGSMESWGRLYILGLFIFTVSIQGAFGLANFAAFPSMFNSLSKAWDLEVENARQAQELEDARQLQLSMLPKEKPMTSQIDISWYMETATEVGGDYYDYTLDSEGDLTIVLGDATGHGMQAGTVVTASKSLFQSMSSLPQIVETFSAMSKGLKSMNFPRLGMAMTMLKINGNKLRLSSAGMPPMLLYRANTGKAEEVLLEGMPLGYSTLADYEERELELSEGDTVLLMSDGLPERMNPDDEWLDYPKTLEAFESVGGQSPDEIIEHLVRVGEEWADGRENDDDESFVCFKFKG